MEATVVDWTVLANFGLPGIMLGFLFLVARMWITSNEKIKLQEIAVEDKKAEAMASALSSLSGKIDTHHTVDIQSHSALASGIAEIRGKLDEAINWQDRTPVENPRVDTGRMQRVAGQYGPIKRPGTRDDR